MRRPVRSALLVASLCAVSGLCAAASLAEEDRYSIYPLLKSLAGPGGSTVPAGINDNLLVTGYSYLWYLPDYPTNTDPPCHAFIYDVRTDTIADLGTLGGRHSTGRAINNRGEVAGGSLIAGDKAYHAFIYSAGKMTDLGTMGFEGSFAFDINDLGQVVGLLGRSGSGVEEAFLYDGGKMVRLGVPPGRKLSCAVAINNHGQIVGDCDNIAYLYENGTWKSLGTLGGTFSHAFDINDAGQIIGISVIPGNRGTHAFIYENGQMRDLGALVAGGDVSPSAINNAGQIVGRADVEGGGSHGFLYEDGVIKDLYSLTNPLAGWTWSYLEGMNNRGQICGHGNHNGSLNQYAFVLDPECTAITSPNGGEIWSGTRNITWTTWGTTWRPGDTVCLEYSPDNGATWKPIAGAEAVAYDAHTFAWDTTKAVPSDGPLFRVRVTPNKGSSSKSSDQSDACFTLRNQAAVYYVNDAATTNDNWCTAPGNDANDGLSPARPKAAVQAVLDAYALWPGDIVRIDTGAYPLARNIEITSADEGSAAAPVKFEASPYGVVLDRGSAAEGSYGWFINGAAYISLTTAQGTKYPAVGQRFAKVTGAHTGIRITGPNCSVSRWSASGNAWAGMALDGAMAATLENCLVHSNGGTAGYGILANASGSVLVSNCTVYRSGAYGVAFDDSSPATLANNIIWADGSGATGVYVNGSVLPESNFNNLYATGGARVGRYGTADSQTLEDWQQATGQDADSLSEDPLFADMDNEDFHELSPSGYYSLASGTWRKSTALSLCVDAGDPAQPAGAEPAPAGSRVNLGAYGNTEQASKSPPPAAPVPLAPIGRVTSGQNPPQFQWTSVSRVLGYGVEIWGSGQYDTASTAWTPAKTLPLNQTIWWRVRSRSQGGYSEWSAWVSFTLQLPVTDFVGTPRSGNKPLAVQFTDKSTGQVTAWSWDFGDGATRDEQNPSHTYTEYGKYTVALTVTRPDGAATATKTDYIEVRPVAPAVAPRPIAPIGEVPGGPNPPAFRWTSVAGAAAYNVEVWGRGVSEVADTTWTPSQALPLGQTVWWRVQAKNAGGTGPWSGWVSFVLLPPARTLKVTIKPSGSGTVTRSPDKAGYKDGEWVLLAAKATTGWKFSQWGGAVAGTGPSAWVRIAGDTVVQATFVEDKTLGVPVPLGPIGNIPTSPNPPPFAWQAAANATAYDIELWGKGTYSAGAVTWQPQGALARSTLIWWRVRGRDGTLVGAWSPWVWFNMNLVTEVEASAAGGAPRLAGVSPAPGESSAGVRVIRLTFDRAVTVNAALLELYGDSAGRLTGFTVQYADAGRTVTLEMAKPLAADRYSLILRSAGVWTTEGGRAVNLDGEIADPDDPASLPSGDGTPGGDAETHFCAQ